MSTGSERAAPARNGKPLGPALPPPLQHQQKAAEWWARTLVALRKPKDQHAFETWLQPLQVLGFTSENTLVLLSQTKPHARIVTRKFGQQIEQKLGCKVEIYDVDSYERTQQNPSTNGHHPSSAADIRSFSEVLPRRLHWLWLGRIPQAKITVLVGEQSMGKSLLSLDIAARVSRGHGFPDGAKCRSGAVIIASSEDDPEDTIRPRLEAARADLRAVHFLRGFETTGSDGQKRFDLFSLERHIGELEAAISASGAVLMIADPISSFVGGTDARSNSEVRALLHPLVEMLGRTHCAFLALQHFRKAEGLPLHRVMDSLAFTAVARTVHGVTQDPADPTRHLLHPLKNNLAPLGSGLAYRIVAPSDIPVVQWERGDVQADAHVLFSGLEFDADPGAIVEATKILADGLADGAQPCTLVQKWAKEAGVSWRTFRRATKEMGIRKWHKSPKDPWMYELPKGGKTGGHT
jgi:putative DNA primase/helicase